MQTGLAVEEAQQPSHRHLGEEPGEERGAVDAAAVQGPQHHRVHGTRAGRVGGRGQRVAARAQGFGDGPRLALDGGERVPRGRPGGAARRADAEDRRRRPAGEAGVGHGDDAGLGRGDLEAAEAQHVAGVAAQRLLVGVSWEDGAGELGVLHECPVAVGGQQVAEGESLRGLRHPEVHEQRRAGVERRAVGAHEPAAEVLQQGGAGRREAGERPGVEHPAGVHGDGAAVVGAREDLGAAGVAAHRLDGRLQPSHVVAVGQGVADVAFEVVGAQHLVAERGDVVLGRPAGGVVYAQPPPFGGHGVVVAPVPRFPVAPGAPRWPEGARRGVQQHRGHPPALPGGVREAVGEGESGCSRAQDGHLCVQHEPLPPSGAPHRRRVHGR